MFVVFEGITSTGKTTIAKMLVKRLSASGRRVFFNHEPTDASVFGQIARKMINNEKVPKLLLKKARKTGIIPGVTKKLLAGKLPHTKGFVWGKLTPLEFQMLYMADRRDDLQNIILKKISHSEWVIQDRYEVSTFAYGLMQGVSLKKLRTAQNKILGEVYWKPDILFYFDVDPALAVQRLRASGKTIDEFETFAKVKKTRAAYKKVIKNRDLYHKLYIIDASRTVDEVFREVLLRLCL